MLDLKKKSKEFLKRLPAVQELEETLGLPSDVKDNELMDFGADI